MIKKILLASKFLMMTMMKLIIYRSKISKKKNKRVKVRMKTISPVLAIIIVLIPMRKILFSVPMNNLRILI